ncbi:hypothetical protein IAR50_001119 [Cryptococcus sp. DSM 104548]
MPTSAPSRPSIARSSKQKSKKPPPKHPKPPPSPKVSYRGPYAEVACNPCRKGHRRCKNIRTIAGRAICGLCEDQHLHCTWPDAGPPTGHGRMLDRLNNTYTTRDPSLPSWKHANSHQTQDDSGDSSPSMGGEGEEDESSEPGDGEQDRGSHDTTHHTTTNPQLDREASPPRPHRHLPRAARPQPHSHQHPRNTTRGHTSLAGLYQPIPSAPITAGTPDALSSSNHSPPLRHLNQDLPPPFNSQDSLEVLAMAALVVEGKRSALGMVVVDVNEGKVGEDDEDEEDSDRRDEHE